jgi:hypothetical protein
MLRLQILSLSRNVVHVVERNPKIRDVDFFVRVLSTTSNEPTDVKKFISDVLTSKKFSKSDIESEVAKFDKANVKTMDLLRKLNMHDYEQTGISVGAARAIQDALWELKHEEVVKKTETKMKLRRENSSRVESKQKRL